MNKAIFLDKDGTLLFNEPYNVDPTLIILEDDILEGLKRLQDSGFMLIIVTNQSGVAHGYFKEEKLVAVQKQIEILLREGGIYLDGFFYCPHHPDGEIKEYAITCDCRKPAPGMLLEAANHFEIDLSRSWMIGDILNDIEAGNRAGCRTILINNENETEWELTEKRIPDLISGNINEATEQLLIIDNTLSPQIRIPAGFN